MKQFSLRSTWNPFVAVAITVLPAARDFEPVDWRDFREQIEDNLSQRPRRLQLQLKIFLRLLELLPIPRFGKSLHSLTEPERRAFLARIEHSRIAPLRNSFREVQRLISLGYPGAEKIRQKIAYRATPKGSAR